jgi:dihydropteroate synthase
MLLRARDFEFRFPGAALVMGIVNVTPDSFSDAGETFKPEAAIARGRQLVEQGAAMVDVGGESTRPGAPPVDEMEEIRRVIPVIEGLAAGMVVPISIDTMKPGVAREALRAGASIVNDVTANRADETMWHIVAKASAGYICMHMQGTPQTMQAQPHYGDVVGEVRAFFFERIQRLSHCGVTGEQIILDPGIGFGKTPDHNLQLLANLRGFAELGRPMALGVSRKSFMGKVMKMELAERLPAALACTSLAIEAGVQIIRTHDVPETIRTARMTEAILAKRNP